MLGRSRHAPGLTKRASGDPGVRAEPCPAVERRVLSTRAAQGPTRPFRPSEARPRARRTSTWASANPCLFSGAPGGRCLLWPSPSRVSSAGDGIRCPESEPWETGVDRPLPVWANVHSPSRASNGCVSSSLSHLTHLRNLASRFMFPSSRPLFPSPPPSRLPICGCRRGPRTASATAPRSSRPSRAKGKATGLGVALSANCSPATDLVPCTPGSRQAGRGLGSSPPPQVWTAGSHPRRPGPGAGQSVASGRKRALAISVAFPDGKGIFAG